jgi:ubiquinone/menaquinone biosynthesis C-methylase UbiE
MSVLDPGEYEAWFESPLGRRVWEDEQAALRSLIGPTRDQRILDVGAGGGRFARELVEDGAEVVALDRSHAMSAAARLRSHDGRHLLQPGSGDAMALPFRAKSFDTVVAVTLLCFLENPEDALREMARVARSDGKVVIGDLGRWSAWTLSRRLGPAKRRKFWRAARFWTSGELGQLMVSAGLAPQQTRSAVFYPPARLAARVMRRLDRQLGEGGGCWGTRDEAGEP